MTDQSPADPQPVAPSVGAPVSLGQDERVTTGVAGVDQVLREVDSLDELPIEDHLAVFEHAHESLRAALDQAPDAVAHDSSGGTSVGWSGGQPGDPA